MKSLVVKGTKFVFMFHDSYFTSSYSVYRQSIKISLFICYFPCRRITTVDNWFRENGYDVKKIWADIEVKIPRASFVV